ncbi:MAG: 3'-5' exonuclease [Deltaproteobacteria bacterium]|nr:3'-5' exonuclease [Deltaproteobacteria bacterium]
MTQLSLALDEYVVFDFETTGLSPWAGDEVIEIGALKIFGNEIDETAVFHSLVNPKRPISPEASAINGITNEMVANAPTINEVFPTFLDFVGSAWLVAQNAKFDMGFLTKYLVTFNLSRKLEVYDTMIFSRRAFPREHQHNLDMISKRLGLQIAKAERHRSLGDVKLTAKAFIALREMLGNNCPNPEKWTV